MATISGYSSKNGYDFYVVLSDTAVGSSSNNTSKVYYELYIKNNNKRFNGSNYVVNMTINGTNYGTTKTINTTTVGFTEACLILSGTSNAIAHNNDGTKSVSIFASVSRSSYSSYDGGYMELSGTFTMQTIARYFSSTPTLTYDTSFKEETKMKFSWHTSEACSEAVIHYGTNTASQTNLNTQDGTFTLEGLAPGTNYNVYVTCRRKDSSLTSDSASQTKATYSYPYISVIGNQQITIPAPGNTIAQSLTLYNPLSRSVTITTKIGNTSIVSSSSTTTGTSVNLSLVANSMYTGIGGSAKNGTITYTCSYSHDNTTTTTTATSSCITSATNCGPTVSANPTYTNTNSTHANLVGSTTIIQGQSSFSVTVPAVTFRGGASISKYYFKIGANGAYENNGTATTRSYSSTSLSGSVDATIYAEDTRGYTTVEKTVTMSVLPYTAPTADIVVARDGYTTTATITLNSAKRSKLYKNGVTTTDVNNWRGNTSSNKISLAISPSGPSLSASVIGGAGDTLSTATATVSNASEGSSYTITVNISDRITTKTLSLTLNKAAPIMSMLNTNRVGINKVDPTCALDVNGDVKMTNAQAQQLTLSKTSWLYNSAAMIGSKQGTATTIPNLITELRYTNGQMGSLQLTASYTLNNITISTGWYNYIWIPHRNGGSSGSASGDNCNYGQLILVGMTVNNKIYKIRYSGGSITELTTGGSDAYPIGSVYINIDGTNPKTYFGGTWEKFGEGRTLVGVDPNDSDFNGALKTGGSKALQSHTHTMNGAGSHSHTVNGGSICAAEWGWLTDVTGFRVGDHIDGYRMNQFQGVGDHTHTINSAGTGNSGNLQPYITVYFWKRTA